MCLVIQDPSICPVSQIARSPWRETANLQLTRCAFRFSELSQTPRCYSITHYQLLTLCLV